MKNSSPGWKPNLGKQVCHYFHRLRSQISLPTSVLITLLLIAFLAGTGLYLKVLDLEGRLAVLNADGQNEELQSLKMSNEWLKNRVAILQEEKAVLLDTAVADLDRKSRIIESILKSVGVDIKIQLSRENSGGPFTSSAEATGDELIMRADQYLDTIQDIPLGAPVPGVLTSRFGWRNDPINGKRAYHRGVDIRGERGSDIKATADGTVKLASYARDGDGRYILIDHGNGFVTKYAHLKKSFVNKGDAVSRGQVIGLVGSTGRSTGPHVHYEIHYNDKIVNPTRFVRIARYLRKYKNK
jgi:murein DD-endopeptidase MepM/ murein hydrolase activator NlpD